jgi:trans-2,3-dihydro-3-hydroxyanthranilate isomerase
MGLQHWYALSLVRRSYRYLHFDVFTASLFGGNQLAVFLDGRGLREETMQAIAKEMNFSESTFVLPPERADTDMRVRIFTPGEELPMAGHPTIGTAFALARSGVVSPAQARVVFGLGVGPTDVELVWHDDDLSFAWMTQLTPQFGPALPNPGAAAAPLGLPAAAVASTGLPVQRVSCGTPYLLIPLATRAAVDQAILDIQAYTAFRAAAGLENLPVFLFSTEAGADNAGVYARMFAPGLGIVEDPATGSAAGPLGCYLVRHKAVRADQAAQMLILQGARMGRPSYMHTSIGVKGGDITTVRVGGQSVVAGEGSLYV